MKASAPMILRLDVAGRPVGWSSWQETVCLYFKDRIAWTLGQTDFTIYGGTCRLTGERSRVSINSIVAVKGHGHYPALEKAVPPLSNRELFLRDAHLCMYCGVRFASKMLTRDHVTPLHQGGKNTWANLVTACKDCNARKGGRTPEQARMPLLAVPFVPNWAEYLVLTNRRILADQMEFLKAQLGKNSRLLHLQ
jgi:hypothetical protein